MTTIELNAEERSSGRLNQDNIALAKQAIEQDGFVVLEDIVNPAHLSILRERMLEDLPKILNSESTPFNFTKSNVQQDPPPFAPYLFRDILANDYVIDVTEAVLGQGVVNSFYSGNTALPNTTQRQPTHADMGHLWPDMANPTPAYALVVNIPVVDMDVDNGSTELWPGTHRDTSVALQSGDITASEEALEGWRSITAPIQPKIKAGSVLIRDMRLWHGGTPNPSDNPRPMIAMIHWVGWWHHEDRMPFAPEAEKILDHPRLKTHAEFVKTPINYLHL